MIKQFVLDALKEDIGRGDLFSLVAQDGICDAKIIAKEEGILAGEVYAKALCEAKNIEIVFNLGDGEKIAKNDVIATLNGDIKTLLICERTLLNLLQHASGIATNTYAFKKALGESNIKLLDTRKTRPLLRNFEKYAVRCGGGYNHRMGLDDCLMLKDTHLKTIPNLKEFMTKCREKLPFTCKVEIECEDVAFSKEAMECGADIVMCDNMNEKQICEVVAIRDEFFKHVLIEISGNVTKENIAKYATCRADAISSGSLIHHAVWLDFSMKITSK
ncbi:MAG: carboxylating nicotinate-nucleotide diphosphorylase [Sulfurospirillaceae bacterium]|nr:carboxylating nicotinate-nucleotide diphosphorylase [Sulfurospirillaceae bacterium]